MYVCIQHAHNIVLLCIKCLYMYNVGISRNIYMRLRMKMARKMSFRIKVIHHGLPCDTYRHISNGNCQYLPLLPKKKSLSTIYKCASIKYIVPCCQLQQRAQTHTCTPFFPHTHLWIYKMHIREHIITRDVIRNLHLQKR